MSEDHIAKEKAETVGPDLPIDADGEYEEISSDEVDRVVTALDVLIQTVESENIQVILEDALDTIYHLVYENEDELDQPSSEAA